MKRELWLDLDGTLLGSKTLKLNRYFLRHSIAYFRKEVGLSFLQSLKQIHFMRKAIETEGSSLLNEERAALVLQDRLKVSKSEALLRVHGMANYTFSKMEPCFFVIEDAKEFVEWAHSRFDLVLATNPVWPESVVKMRLGWAGIPPERFQMITHSSSMNSCKPSVEYYRELLFKRMPDVVSPAQAVLMIGDSIKKDSPAIKAGVPFFWLKSRQNLKKDSAQMWSGDFSALKTFLTKEWM